MQAYRVNHKHSGSRYYTLADSPEHAVEIVTLHIGDAGGRDAWVAIAEAPAYGLARGIVLDEAGKPVAVASA